MLRLQGIFSPDRDPHPAVQELKYLQQPVAFSPARGGESIKVSIVGKVIDRVNLNVENRYLFRDPSHLEWHWSITCDVSISPVARGAFAIEEGSRSGIVVNIDSARSKIQELAKLASFHEPIEYWFGIKGTLKKDETWAKQGHVVVTQQFPLILRGIDVPIFKKGVADSCSLSVHHDDSTISISRASNEAQAFLVIDKRTGMITSMSSFDGTNLLARNCAVEECGIHPNYTRAITDNDRGGIELLLGFVLPSHLRILNPFLFRIYGFFKGFHDLSYSWFWQCSGLMPDSPPIIKCIRIDISKTSANLQIDASCSVIKRAGSIELLAQSITYSVFDDGRVKIETHVRPKTSISRVPSLARVGFEAVLDAQLYNMTYYGRGEVENYSDRKAGTEMGIWRTTVEGNEFEYIVPSENGNKSDCRWVAFQDAHGRGIGFVADPDGDSINVGATLNSQTVLHHALHTCDLSHRRNGEAPIYAHIDHRLMGVGGDVSWFPVVYPDYLVKPDKDFHYSLWLVPLSEGDDPLLRAKNVTTMK